MEITEEQRRRAEANRLAALEKLNRAAEGRKDTWSLFRCRKIPNEKPQLAAVEPPCRLENPITDRFYVYLEICAPDAFSISAEPMPGFPFPGKAECLRRIDDFLLADVHLCKESQVDGKASRYMLKDYDEVSKCLKKYPGIRLQEIPWKTVAVLQKFSTSYDSNCWNPCFPGHYADNEVDELIEKLPVMLRETLLPFQLDGLRYGLRRGGRCLLADEMGLGKTIQAIAIASCFMNEGKVLVVCPAVLRFSWAEELERWLPCCLPTDIHLVFGRKDNLSYLSKCPKIVVISYTMLQRLRKSMLDQEWAVMILDESHNVRCTKKALEADETQVVLDMASKVRRIILLSGTPSLSRPFDIFHQINILWPGLLGKDKYEFADNYCLVKYARGCQGKIFKDFSNGIRLEELNVLLRQTVMVRRLKENVLVQLPPKRRQVIRLKLKGQDIRYAIEACREGQTITQENIEEDGCLVKPSTDQSACHGDGNLGVRYETKDSNHCRTTAQLSYQELGIAKLFGVLEWLSSHSIVTESEGAANLDACSSSQKMIIFAHHIKVLDGVQEFACEKGIGFVRIDGRTLARDRKAAVETFRSSKEVKVALIGITAGGVGLDFSSAKNVVFVELPKSASEMLQAEDRAHRRGQINAVNIYIFCAKNTSDEPHWQNLNRSLCRVSSMMNGKEDAMQRIQVDKICNLSQFAFSQIDEASSSLQIGDGIKCSSKVNELCEGIAASHAVPEPVDGVSEGATFLSSQEGYVASPSEIKEVLGSMMSFTNEADTHMEKLESEDIKEDKACFSCSEEPKLPKYSCVNSITEAEKAIQTRTSDAKSGLIQADSLRFEVSQYTGRVHLYSCIPGEDTRPRPIFENFRTEELESMACAANTKWKEAANSIKENPAYRNVLLAFVSEWNKLRGVERNKLLGKPLQLPLELELLYLKENINHGSTGLLKGGSRRRVTPLNDLCNPLPDNAVWKKILLQKGSKNRQKEYSQAWSKMDEPLCKLCQLPCRGNPAKSPEFFEDLFCTLSCFEDYRMRTSQRYLRQALFQVEYGICAICKLDCHKLVESMRPLSIQRRKEHVEKVAPKVASNKNLLEKLVSEPIEGNAWHADHIVPVYKGGGECRVENMRTLCVACHSEVTAAQQAERRLMRIKAKEQLKSVINELKQEQEHAVTSGVKGHVFLEAESNKDELLISVPGSAYSGDLSLVSENEHT